MKTKWLPTQSSTEILRGSETHTQGVYADAQVHRHMQTHIQIQHRYAITCTHKHTLPPQSTLTHVYKRTYTQTCTQTHTQGHRKEVGYKQQIIFKQLFGKKQNKNLLCFGPWSVFSRQTDHSFSERCLGPRAKTFFIKIFGSILIHPCKRSFNLGAQYGFSGTE